MFSFFNMCRPILLLLITMNNIQNVSSVFLFGLFGESETGDGRGGGVYYAKVFGLSKTWVEYILV